MREKKRGASIERPPLSPRYDIAMIYEAFLWCPYLSFHDAERSLFLRHSYFLLTEEIPARHNENKVFPGCKISHRPSEKLTVSGIMGALLGASINPSVHQSNDVLRGCRWAFNWDPMMPREASLS